MHQTWNVWCNNSLRKFLKQLCCFVYRISLHVSLLYIPSYRKLMALRIRKISRIYSVKYSPYLKLFWIKFVDLGYVCFGSCSKLLMRRTVHYKTVWNECSVRISLFRDEIKLNAVARCVVSGYRRGVNEIFALLACYTAYLVSYRQCGTIYPSHLQGS